MTGIGRGMVGSRIVVVNMVLECRMGLPGLLKLVKMHIGPRKLNYWPEMKTLA